MKAIAVRAPRKEVPVVGEEGPREVINEISKLIRDDPEGTLANIYRNYGTPAMVATANALKLFPTCY